MTTSTIMTPTTLPWLVKRGALALWHELPRSLAAGALALAAMVPLAVAVVAGAPGWLLAITTLPVALTLTGLAHFAAGVVRADSVHMRALRLDPTLALAIAGLGSLAGLGLASGGFALVAGAVGAAILLIVAPLALAYGAVRDRGGLDALRGGVILAAFRPSWALTLLALGCLGGFAVAASAGILAIVVLPLQFAIANSFVAELLETIDAQRACGAR
jgi:hypothetical protein